MTYKKIAWQKAKIGKQDQWLKNNRRSVLIWIASLSGQGKSSGASSE